MKHSKHIILITCVAVAFVFALAPGCKKESVSDSPVITFDSIMPNPCIAYQDTIRIVISYKDGDGDLGQNATTTKNLFVTDSRDTVISQFTIPQLAPNGYTGAIQGNLDILLPPQYFINNSDTTETATYSIYVTDRAGHHSNTITSAPLVITR